MVLAISRSRRAAVAGSAYGRGSAYFMGAYLRSCSDCCSLWHQLAVMRGLCSTDRRVFPSQGRLSMKKIILVGLAILAVSTSGALAKKAMKPKATAAATTTGSAAPLMLGQVSAADLALYKKNQHDSGMKK